MLVFTGFKIVLVEIEHFSTTEVVQQILTSEKADELLVIADVGLFIPGIATLWVSWIIGSAAGYDAFTEEQPVESARERWTMRLRNYAVAALCVALAKQLAEQHGGGIDVASEGRGKGATFTVSFPLARAIANVVR